MTLIPKLSNFLFSPRHRRGLSRFGYNLRKPPRLELDASDCRALFSSSMTMHVNKVHHVTTINRVANEPRRRRRLERCQRNGIEDAIWVYGVGEDRIQAFADFGIENLIELGCRKSETSQPPRSASAMQAV
jgi:hypothetical protein